MNHLLNLLTEMAGLDKGYLVTGIKEDCSGCEACVGICHKDAINMIEDSEGFRYPQINKDLCVGCGLCRKVCINNVFPIKHEYNPKVFGGHNKNAEIWDKSTSGGIFSALAQRWSADGNYVIFGAYAEGLDVYHGYVDDIAQIAKFRKSKYSQSSVGSSYQDAKRFLKEGKRVLFSGTPCQIAALQKILGPLFESENLLTIEVVCEGFPSPLFIRKYVKELEEKEKSKLKSLDYRFKNGSKWDFECMRIEFDNGKTIVKDRWFLPFWVFWMKRLMSRPSCVTCQFRTPDRVADITLGDLWGVQKYCPELYSGNKGATLIFCNSYKGKLWLKKTMPEIEGNELNPDDALTFQRPMRTIVPANPERDIFMSDLKVLGYSELCKKWNGKEPLKVLVHKYVWGSNRQVVAWFKFKSKLKSMFNR